MNLTHRKLGWWGYLD